MRGKGAREAGRQAGRRMAHTWEHVPGAGPRCACEICRDLRARGVDHDAGFDDGSGLGAYPWGYKGNGCVQCLAAAGHSRCAHHALVEEREAARQRKAWEHEARFVCPVELDFDAGLVPGVLELGKAVLLDGPTALFRVTDASKVPAALMSRGTAGCVECARVEFRSGRWCALSGPPMSRDRQWISLADLEPVSTADANLLVALSPDLCCSLPADLTERGTWCALCGGRGGKNEWDDDTGEEGDDKGGMRTDSSDSEEDWGASAPPCPPTGAATMASAHAANEHGLVCYGRGDFAGAMEACGRAARLLPLSAPYAYNFACAAGKAGKFPAAAKGARAAMANDPNHAKAGHLLAAVLLAAAQEMSGNERRNTVLEAALVTGTEAAARCGCAESNMPPFGEEGGTEGYGAAYGAACARCKRWEADRGKIVMSLLHHCEGGDGADSDSDSDEDDLCANPEDALRRADMQLSHDPTSVQERLARCHALVLVGAGLRSLDELKAMRDGLESGEEVHWSSQEQAKLYYIEALAMLSIGGTLLREALVCLRQSLAIARVGKAVRLECTLLHAAAAHATLFGRFPDPGAASASAFTKALASLLSSECPEIAYVACDLRCGHVLALLYAANRDTGAARVLPAAMEALDAAWTSGGSSHEATILLRALCLRTQGGKGVGAACLAALSRLRDAANLDDASHCRFISPMRLEALWTEARDATRREVLEEEARHEQEAYARAAARRADTERARRPGGPADGRGDSEHSPLDSALAVLDLTPSATAAEVRNAYKRGVMKWHPDKWATRHPIEIEAASERFALISDAYEVALAHLPPDDYFSNAPAGSMVDSRIPVV